MIYDLHVDVPIKEPLKPDPHARAPCSERHLLIRAALTQCPFAPVFDSFPDALPVVSALKFQPQHAEV